MAMLGPSRTPNSRRYSPEEKAQAVRMVREELGTPGQVGGTIVRVIQAPGDALRLLSRDPQQAAAWTASLVLLALALQAIRRRQHAMALIGQD